MNISISPYQWGADLLEEVINTLWRLMKTKPALIDFFRGAGVPSAILNPVIAQYQSDKQGTKKPVMARTVLTALNALGDTDEALRARREVLKRITEFEDFSQCWPDDQPHAELGVRHIRDLIGKKDSFTAMRMAKDREAAQRRATTQSEAAIIAQGKAKIEAAKNAFLPLFAIDNPQERGRSFEAALTELFRAHDILIREPFIVRAENGVATEQIDGAIEFGGMLWLVEAKWLMEGIDAPAVTQHCWRVCNRPSCGGLFISGTGYRRSAIAIAKEALPQAPIILMTLQELWAILESHSDLAEALRDRSHQARLNKQPYIGTSVHE